LLLLRSFRLSTYLTLALACLCLGYAEGDLLPETPYITAVVIVLIAVAHRVEGRWSLSLQSANSVGAVLTLALIGWIGFQFVRGSSSLLDVLPFPAYLLPYLGPVLMILIPAKLFRPKHIGDFWAIQGVGLLAVTLGCAMANDAFFGVLLILYVFCFAWSLVMFYLYREVQPDSAAEQAEGETGSPSLLLKPAIGWTMAVVGAGLFLFLITPRPADRKWELSVMARNRLETGLPEGAIDLNRTGSLEQNSEVAFQVYADYADGRPKLDLPADQRWRATSLSRYEGGRWVREGNSGLTLLDRTIPFPRSRLADIAELDKLQQRNARLPDFGPEAYYLTFTLQRNAGGNNLIADPVVWRPNDVPPVFVFLTRTGSVQQHQDGRFEWMNLIGPGKEGYCQVTVPQPEPDLSPPLRLASNNQEFLTWIMSNDMADRMRRYTTQILERMVKEEKLPAAVLQELDPQTRLPLEKHHEAIARALEQYLSSSGEFHYTYDLTRKDKAIDPIEDFLYNTRTGHCQRFASALVLMLRSQGVPAQLVIGFRGCESQENGHYVVRQSSAHAWVEALIPRSPPANQLSRRPDDTSPVLTEAYHWLSLDPTPGGEPVKVRPTGFASWFEDTRAWVETQFRSIVLGYDSTARDQAAEAIAIWLEDTRDELFDAHWNTTKSVAAIIAGLMAFLLIRRLRRRRHTAVVVVPFHARLLSLLETRGFVARPEQTPREFIDDVVRRHPAAADHLITLCDAFYRVRFGGQVPSDEELTAIDERLRQLPGILD